MSIYSGVGDGCRPLVTPGGYDWYGIYLSRNRLAWSESIPRYQLPLLLLLCNTVYLSIFDIYLLFPFDILCNYLTIIKWKWDDVYNNISGESLIGCCIAICYIMFCNYVIKRKPSGHKGLAHRLQTSRLDYIVR